MKKQIFILVFLVVATFANVANSYAATCDNALSPIAGKTYTYGISVSPTGGTFNWYVTTSADLMPATSTKADPSYLIGGTGYNAPGTGTSTVQITWSSKAVKEALAGTTKFYLVVNYALTGCTDNLKAYKITPINLFGILVENVDAAGAPYAADNICRSAVQSATVNGTGIDYNYGSNTFYLKVTAQYFTTSWTPTIDITALKASLDVSAGNQSITSIEWSTSTTFTGTSNFDLATGVATAAVIDKGADGITSGTDEFVYVKIVIAHGKFEGVADQTIALNLSAADASGNPDVDLDASCVALAVDPDKVSQVLKARPTVTALPATGVFMLPN
jgi:hypothetical protein